MSRPRGLGITRRLAVFAVVGVLFAAIEPEAPAAFTVLAAAVTTALLFAAVAVADWADASAVIRDAQQEVAR